jgi:AhpD family alkylhydroperoxidase
MAFIKEPKIPKSLNRLLHLIEKKIGARMAPARLLLWSPKAFVSSMILEGLIAHHVGQVTPRMLKLIRMQVSLRINCAFCIDMNSQDFRKHKITETEIHAMQGRLKISQVDSFSYQEKLALYYALSVVRTPISINPRLVNRMTSAFTEKEYSTIVTTIGQVDYWTRLIQGYGIQPAGFLEQCDLEILMK